MAVSWISAFLIGIYDGFYGPGTGTFLILIFMGLAHMTSMEAAAYTKIVNLSSNIASLVTFLMSGQVILPLGTGSGCFQYSRTLYRSRHGSEKRNENYPADYSGGTGPSVYQNCIQSVKKKQDLNK